jgi:hypothetical protein
MKVFVILATGFAAVLLASANATAAASETNVAPEAAEKDANTSRATPEEIAAWIAQLDDNRYLEREHATSRLLKAGDAALDPLLAAANADRPEPADRAVWILRRIANSPDVAVRRPALERLVQLRERPQVAGAARDTLMEIRHGEAVAAIQQLGGRYVSIAGQHGMQIGPYTIPRVELDREWRGGDAGIVHFRDLVGVPQVVVIGADVSAKGIAELQHMPHLEDLLLYGTKLTEADLPKIKTAMPHVTIDYRRGGLLGVGSIGGDKTGPASVGHVQPDSAAAQAGIQVGDIITTFQGEPVQNFESLTKMIGKHAQGDEVSLQVLRGSQTIEFKVKLGEWKTVN